MADKDARPLSLVRQLIPVRRHYTLYTDLSRQLRWLSHRGEANVENQPLLSGIAALRLRLVPLLNGKILQLSGEIEAVGGQPRRFSLMHRLGRFDHLNLLLNRP